MRFFLYRHFDATLMSTASVLRAIGNKVYEQAFPIYRPLYDVFKRHADRAERELLSMSSLQAPSWLMPAPILAFIPNFSRAVSVRPAPCIHSNLRPTISSDCALPRVGFQMYA